MVYDVILRRGEASGYLAECPAIPGCVSQGRTKREALANLKDAMVGCLAVILVKVGERPTLSVPDHKALDPGLLRSLLRHAELSVEEFIRLLD